MGLVYKSADSEVKERVSNDKEAFYKKIAYVAAYRNDLRNASINKLTNFKPHIPPCIVLYIPLLQDQNGIIHLKVDEQIKEWQKHYECPGDIAEEIEAENEVNRRNNHNRSITTEPPSIGSDI